MDDTISRQAAVDVIDRIFPADPMKSDYTQGIACGAALAKAYIKQLPSAQPDTPMRGSKVAETAGNITDRTTGDCISRAEAIRVASGYCHPSNIAKELERLPSAEPEITECPMCPDCPDNCPLEVEHDNK